MSHIVRKPVFGVSDLVRHKPGCTITEEICRGLKFRIKKVEGLNCTIYVAKTKALISCAVTANLITGYRESDYREADLRLCFPICRKPVFS